MATNYNLNSTKVTDAYTTGHPVAGRGVKTLQAFVDVTGKTTSDTFTLFKLPAGSAVIAANISVVEIAGETCTIDVGLQSGTTTVGQTYIAGADVNQAAGTVIVGSGTDMIQGSDIQQAISSNTNTSAVYVGAKIASGSTLAAGKFIVSCVVVLA